MDIRNNDPQPMPAIGGCGSDMVIDNTRRNPGENTKAYSEQDTFMDKKRSWSWNKIGLGVGAAAAVAGAAYAARKMSFSSEDDFQMRLETDETVRLISSKKVEGTPVVDKDGQSIGTVDSFMVDKYTGRVAYAVMRFGGTWGFGSSLFPLPWPVLDYDEQAGGYKLAITKEQMNDAPRFEEANEPEFDATYRRRVILFYRPE